MCAIPGLGRVAIAKDPYLKESNGKILTEQKKIAEGHLKEMGVSGIQILIGRVTDYQNADDAHYEDGEPVSLFKGGKASIFPKYITTSTVGEDGENVVYVGSEPYGSYETAKNMGEEPILLSRKAYLVPLYAPIGLKVPEGVIPILPSVSVKA